MPEREAGREELVGAGESRASAKRGLALSLPMPLLPPQTLWPLGLPTTLCAEAELGPEASSYAQAWMEKGEELFPLASGGWNGLRGCPWVTPMPHYVQTAPWGRGAQA